MGKAARALTLILLLACSAQAGYIQNEVSAPTPPSQPAGALEEQMDNSQEPTADSTMQNEELNGLTWFTLDVLAALPSLF